MAPPATDKRTLSVSSCRTILPRPAPRASRIPYRIAKTDQNGRFAMMGITPGDYKLFSWDGLEPFRYMDPDFISKFESDGTPVHVDESSTQSIQVKMIPAV